MFRINILFLVLPPVLWNELRSDRKAWKVVMDAVIETMKMVLWLNVQ